MRRLLTLIALMTLAAAPSLWAQNSRPQTGYGSPSERLPLPPPEQPIPYSHKLHVGKLGLKCADCHQADRDGFMMDCSLSGQGA